MIARTQEANGTERLVGSSGQEAGGGRKRKRESESKRERRMKARYGARTGMDRGEEESVSLITTCDTLNSRGASQCNIHFY